MRYDYTIREISNGWLVLVDTPDDMGTVSTYFEHEFDAFSHVSDLTIAECKKIAETGKDRKQDNEKAQKEL